jgi:branched-chain amino acid transport system permease protein
MTGYEMEIWITRILNGLSFGMLLFLLASGLTLMFGLMRIINLAQGAYYLLGAYIGIEIQRHHGNFFLSVLIAGTFTATIGIMMERFFLRRVSAQPLAQVLLTIGFTFSIADIALMIWGGGPLFIGSPAALVGGIRIGNVTFPFYRLFVIFVGTLIAAFLWWLQEKTRVGMMVRAAVDDEEIAIALGINVRSISVFVFALGAFLAGLAGVMGGPLIGVYPGAELEILLLAIVVIVVGGRGSLLGALVGSLFIGLIDNFGKVFFPEFALFTVFVPMAIVLYWKPSGLFISGD